MTDNPIWRKSSQSVEGTSTQCVELAALPTGIGVRDSKRTAPGHLTLSREQLSEVFASVRTGELDL